MSFFASPEQENGAQFALVVVAQYEMDTIYNQLLENSDQTSLDDLKYSIKPFLEVFLQRIVDFYVKNDEKSLPSDYSTKSLIYNLGPVLLGPDINRAFQVPDRLATNEILESVHKNEHLQPVKSAALAQELVKIVESAHNLITSLHESSSNYRDVLYEYIRGLADVFPQFITGETLPLQVTTVYKYLDNHRTSAPFQQFYPVFKQTLTTQINLLLSNCGKIHSTSATVLKLREQGNNLMLNLGYAQAIQVYTTAINLCTSHDEKNIPQLLTNRAIAYIGLNCYPEARSDLNQAVRLDRCFTPAWTQLGYCHIYMGTCLTGLKCYLAALESLVGEISPPNLPISLVDEYRQNKMDTVLPQFVQRIIQAMILTETRCYQECEDGRTIKAIVGNARRILAKLRSNASSDDLSYYAYLYDYNDGSFRSSAARSNRVEPNILTHDVSQDILASGGFETTAISIPTNSNALDDALDSLGAGNNGGRRIIAIGGTRQTPASTTTTTTNTNGATFTNNNETSGPPPNVRNILNNFGEIFEGTLAAQAGLSGDVNRETPSNSGESADPVRNTLRNILPEGLGGIVTQVLGSLGDVVNRGGTTTVRHFDFTGNPENANSTGGNQSGTPANNSTSSTTNNNGTGDVEMPDPDLD